ncbi:MAG: SPOR domain-containing protein [Oceanisphaera sp.]|uniref:SPOR domain-containing protein n=1 Tax=Oceanisphaera sp. TaxID=1929979 RepID=UPI003F9A9CA5
MATQFQHRLVGTVILVALGVIFLPDVLNGKQQRPPDEAVTIPLRPELEPARALVEAPADSTSDNAPVQSVNESPTWNIEQAQEAPPVAPSAAKPEPVVKPKPAPKPTPQVAAKAEPVTSAAPVATQEASHIVQLGAFRNAENVNALVKKLQAAGYPARTTPAVPQEGEINRVWIGPDNKTRLEQQLKALEQLTGLKGSVRPK